MYSVFYFIPLGSSFVSSPLQRRLNWLDLLKEPISARYTNIQVSCFAYLHEIKDTFFN